MQRFIVEQSEADITSHAGLALAGVALNQYTALAQKLTHTIPRHCPCGHPAQLHWPAVYGKE